MTRTRQRQEGASLAAEMANAVRLLEEVAAKTTQILPVTSSDRRRFLDELAAVCRKHAISLEHEDGHGSFVVAPWSKGSEEWLLAARAEGD